MPFIPRLPTFNQEVLLYQAQGAGVWNPDAAMVACQVYFPFRAFGYAWLNPGRTERGVAGTFGDYQEDRLNIYFLVAKTVNVRGPVQVWTALNSAPDVHDYLEYTNVNSVLRSYWIDMVEPRWAGFPNEHKVIVATERWVELP